MSMLGDYKRLVEAPMIAEYESEIAGLREQVRLLTDALAEAMVICARHSPGGVDGLREFLSAREKQA